MILKITIEIKDAHIDSKIGLFLVGTFKLVIGLIFSKLIPRALLNLKCVCVFWESKAKD